MEHVVRTGEMARDTGLITAVLEFVPNQPLEFEVKGNADPEKS